MKAILVTLFFVLSLSFGFAQQDLLQSGPMVGYSEMKEVKLWIQTKQSAKVYIEYWAKEAPDKKFQTDEVITEKNTAFVAHLMADQVMPGGIYSYAVYINSKILTFNYPLQFQTQELWQWRKDPKDFSFAIGSCNYVNDPQFDRPGKPYGGGHEIFTSIYDKKPDFMIWGGDNLYLREADWNSRTGILYRYTHSRALAELQPLLASVHHFATWDDHDFGPNDSDRGFWNKNITTEAFKLFWLNPNYNATNQGGISGTFQWNDVQFFIMDDRYFRSPNFATGEKVYFGQDQIQWLIDGLTSSKATFKIIVTGGQILNTANLNENYAFFPEERARLIEGIKRSKASGVMFFSGDRHHTATSVLRENDFYPLYDFTVSPLTSSVHQPREEKNSLFVSGSAIYERNFGIVTINGTLRDRIFKLTIYNVQGKEIQSTQIKASELKQKQ